MTEVRGVAEGPRRGASRRSDAPRTMHGNEFVPCHVNPPGDAPNPAGPWIEFSPLSQLGGTAPPCRPANPLNSLSFPPVNKPPLPPSRKKIRNCTHTSSTWPILPPSLSRETGAHRVSGRAAVTSHRGTSATVLRASDRPACRRWADRPSRGADGAAVCLRLFIGSAGIWDRSTGRQTPDGGGGPRFSAARRQGAGLGRATTH
jgi:hypothetical protein